MATMASAHAHRQHGGKQQHLGSALRIDPRVATLAAAALLLATLTGFALAAPLVLLFSPVLVPAALAVAGLAAAGALAVSGASALVRVVGYREAARRMGAPAFVGHRVVDDARDALGTTKARDVAST
ncbi:hypothetical protein VPH35_014576 [Triticum aestivum]